MIDDLRNNQVTDNGRIFLGFNANLNGSFYDDELRKFFIKAGASIWHNEVDIGGPKQNVLFDYLDRMLGVRSPILHPSPH